VTRCRQIERALAAAAARGALWFNAVASTSRFIRRFVDDVRTDWRGRVSRRREIFQKLLMQH